MVEMPVRWGLTALLAESTCQIHTYTPDFRVALICANNKSAFAAATMVSPSSYKSHISNRQPE